MFQGSGFVSGPQVSFAKAACLNIGATLASISIHISIMLVLFNYFYNQNSLHPNGSKRQDILIADIMISRKLEEPFFQSNNMNKIAMSPLF